MVNIDKCYGSSVEELIRGGLVNINNKKDINMARNYQIVQLRLNELSKRAEIEGEEITASAILDLSMKLKKIYNTMGSK